MKIVGALLEAMKCEDMISEPGYPQNYFSWNFISVSVLYKDVMQSVLYKDAMQSHSTGGGAIMMETCKNKQGSYEWGIASDFFHNEGTLQWLEYGKEKLNKVETLWTVGASYTQISPKKVINPMQSHSTGGGAIMMETCKNKQGSYEWGITI